MLKMDWVVIVLVAFLLLASGYGHDVVWVNDGSGNLSYTGGDLTLDTSTLYVDATNDEVGIGTTSPDFKLEVEGSGAVQTATTTTTTNGGTAYCVHNMRAGGSVRGGLYGFAANYSGTSGAFRNSSLGLIGNQSTGVSVAATHASGYVPLIAGGTTSAYEQVRVSPAGFEVRDTGGNRWVLDVNETSKKLEFYYTSNSDNSPTLRATIDSTGAYTDEVL